MEIHMYECMGMVICSICLLHLVCYTNHYKRFKHLLYYSCVTTLPFVYFKLHEFSFDGNPSRTPAILTMYVLIYIVVI